MNPPKKKNNYHSKTKKKKKRQTNRKRPLCTNPFEEIKIQTNQQYIAMELKISKKQKKGNAHFIRKAQKWQEKGKGGWKNKGVMADLPQ